MTSIRCRFVSGWVVVFGAENDSLMDWPGMDFPYIVAVLPNNTIVVHNIETQSVVQTIPVPENLHVRALVSCLEGYLVPSNMETEKMRKTSVRLLREPSPPPPTAEE